MKCIKCGAEFKIQLASKVMADNVRVLTGMTTVLTLQCSKCGHVFQLPLNSNSVMKVDKDKSRDA